MKLNSLSITQTYDKDRPYRAEITVDHSNSQVKLHLSDEASHRIVATVMKEMQEAVAETAKVVLDSFPLIAAPKAEESNEEDENAA